MRLSSILFATAFVSLSINAEDIDRPIIGDHAFNCIRDVNAVANQFGNFDRAIRSFVSTDGEEAAEIVHDKERILEKYLRQSNEDCCVTVRPEITLDEIVAFTDAVNTLISGASSSMSALQEKRSDFTVFKDAKLHIRTLIENLNEETGHLFDCFVFKSPDSTLAAVIGYNDTLNEIFGEAKLFFEA